jgi:hypothetical protein
MQARISGGVSLTRQRLAAGALDHSRGLTQQHWFAHVDEGLLYLHTRTAVTLFDELLHRAFGERLTDHHPLEVLPVGTEPPQDRQTLVDREYARIAELLKPHRRARAQARARLRALLAMEAHVRPRQHSSIWARMRASLR